MEFAQALVEIKLLNRVRRKSWPPRRWVKAHYPDKQSKMQLPYLFECTAEGRLIPWLPTMDDLLNATDWEVKGK